jgi:hypothetical protein
MSVRVGNWLAIVATGALVVGCAGTGTSPQAFNTPEECFQFAQKAASEKNYTAAVDCMTVDTQETLAGVMVAGGTMMKAVSGMAAAFGGGGEDAEKIKKDLEKIDAVLAKHGVTEKTLEEAGKTPGLEGAFGDFTNSGQAPDPTKAMEGIRAMAKPIKDHRAFIADMITTFDAIGDNAGGENPVHGLIGELKNVQINGDLATATIKTSAGQENPISFKKTARGWRIQLDANMFQPQPTSTTTTF